MNQHLLDLQNKIDLLKNRKKSEPKRVGAKGYSISITILTNLLSCILIGFALGLFFQKFFHASVLWIAIFTFFGGIAGLWTTSNFATNYDKRKNS